MVASHWLDWTLGWWFAREKMFASGWGDDAVLARIERGELFRERPLELNPHWTGRTVRGDSEWWHGGFASPVSGLPASVSRGALWWLRPRKVADESAMPVVLLLASSRDEGLAERALRWGPLVREGVSLLVLEHPYYGLRRAPGHQSASLPTVAEQLEMSLATVEEGRALLGWLETHGYRSVGVAGFSMGACLGAMVAALSPQRVATALVAPSDSAAPIYTQGLLSRSVQWQALSSQLGEDAARERLGRLLGRVRLSELPTPRAPEASVLVGCARDGYVPRDEVEALAQHWKGSDLRWVDTGHAGVVVFHQEVLRAAVKDSLAALAS